MQVAIDLVLVQVERLKREEHAARWRLAHEADVMPRLASELNLVLPDHPLARGAWDRTGDVFLVPQVAFVFDGFVGLNHFVAAMAGVASIVVPSITSLHIVLEARLLTSKARLGTRNVVPAEHLPIDLLELVRVELLGA